MRGNYRRVLAATVALLVMVVLAGCGGGGGGNNNLGPQSPVSKPGIKMAIGAVMKVMSLFGSRTPTRQTTIVEAKLDEGATIEVFNFVTGEKITTGTIGSDGYGSVTVTPGLTVVVVVTGKREGKDYRLSYIIPSVPTVDSEVIADPVSTLAAEAISQKYYSKGVVIDEGTVDAVAAVAKGYLDANPDFDISIGGGLIAAGKAFGAADVLDANKLSAVISSVPAQIDDALAKGKNAVQQLKEAGLPWKDIVDQERPSLEGAYQNLCQAASISGVEEVGTKYEGLGTRLLTLMIPALEGDWMYQGVWGKPVIELTVGQGYRAQDMQAREGGWPFSQLELFDDPTAATPNQITVKLPTAEGTYTLVAKQTLGSNWEVTETFDGDAALEYKAVFPQNLEPGADPSITGAISLKDKNVTTPVVFQGTAKATGPDKQHYTAVEFSGTLTSAELSATGKFTANFPAMMPEGAAADQTIYEFPTSFTMTNASVTATVGGATATMRGDVSAKTGIATVDGRPEVGPTEATLTGGSITASNAGKSVTLTGDIAVKGDLKASGDHAGSFFPTSVSVTNCGLTVNDGTTEVKVTGAISGTGKAIVVNGELSPVPTHVKLDGTYSNSATKVSFTGTIEETWENAADNINETNAKGSVTVAGSIQRDTYKAYEVNMAITLDGAGKASCTVTKLGWGSFYLAGNGSCVFAQSGEGPVNASLDLSNQDGVSFHIGEVGAVTVNGQNVGVITEENGMMKITFSDGVVELV